jgi:hypothetical protein
MNYFGGNRPMKKYTILFAPLLLLLFSIAVNAQFYGALSTTWNNPISATASVMIQGVINQKMLERSIANQQGKRGSQTAAANSASTTRTKSQSSSTAADYSMLRFRPVANSGVAKQVADVLGRDPTERSAVLQILEEVKRSYEAEAAKAGNSNDVAAALTFFLATGSMAYHQTDFPADNVTDAMVQVLHQELSVSPEFRSMTDLQKQKLHDWLVVVGGFVLAGYLDAVKKTDAKQLADYKELANASFKLVLGTGAEKFNLAEVK